MYLHKTNKYNILVFLLNCKTLIAIDTGKVRDRFGGMGRFKGGLRWRGWVNNVIINIIQLINYRYMQLFYKIKVQCKNMYTISALYQIINLNASI